MHRSPLRLVAAVALCAVASSGPAPTEAQDAAAEPPEEDRSVRRLGDVVAAGDAEFSMDLPAVESAPVGERPDVAVPDPDRNARLQALLDRRAAVGDTPEIAAALDALLAEIEQAGREALAAGDLDGARARGAALDVLAPERSIAEEIAAKAVARDRIAQALQALDEALAAGRLVEPADASAVAALERLREVAPDAAGAARTRVREALRSRFDGHLSGQRFADAAAWIETVEPTQTVDVGEWRAALRMASQARIDALRETVRAQLDRRDLAAARAALDELVALGAADAVIAPLTAEFQRTRRYGGFEPGQRFSDPLEQGGRAPEMIVVPTGPARLGSPAGEPGRFDDEGPAFTVSFDRGFALSVTEITVGQFRAFVRATGYRTNAEREGMSNAFDRRAGGLVERRFVDWEHDYLGEPADDDLPVVHVSYNDARAYADWLAGQTGQPYRLPSEAEFEYALRAGTATRFWWGSGSPGEPHENLAGDGDRLGREQRWSDAFEDYRDGFWGPAPVATFGANPFGLHDMGGNVLEWTADCWIAGYADPPADGRVRTGGNCARRVLRGGAWSNGPATSRSAYRLSGPADFRDARVGFRVARDLRAGAG